MHSSSFNPVRPKYDSTHRLAITTYLLYHRICVFLSHLRFLRCSLGVYDKTTILFPVDITEDVVELVAHKLSGSSGPGSTDSKAIQGWILKPREDRKSFVLVLKFWLTG